MLYTIINLIKYLNSNTGFATLFAVLAALYLGSAFHQIRKDNKIKIKSFRRRIKKEIYPRILSQYLKHDMDERLNRTYGNEQTIQQYHHSNKDNLVSASTQYTLVYTNYNILTHSSELEFFNYLVDNNIIYRYVQAVHTKNDLITRIEYILIPSEVSWNKVEKDYKKSSEYKTRVDLNHKLCNALFPDKFPNKKTLVSFFKGLVAKT